jgi:hypothetical protein
MRMHGHEGTIRFRGINSEFLYGQVLAGESGAVPGPTETPLHGEGLSTAQGRGPSRRPLRRGDAVVIDLSGLAEGYVSDQTRTFFIGPADPGLLAAYETCRSMLAECVALLRPRTPGGALYERALEIAAEAGYAEHFMGAGDGRVRFVGHCIGLELNEPPYLARGYSLPLEAGNVVAIEPKLAFTGLGAPLRLTTNVPLSYIEEERPFLLDRDCHMVLTYGEPLQAGQNGVEHNPCRQRIRPRLPEQRRQDRVLGVVVPAQAAERAEKLLRGRKRGERWLTLRPQAEPVAQRSRSE